MGRFARRLLDFFILTSDFFLARKYDALSRQLGVAPDRRASSERGFVVIQIDALAYAHLLDAMDKGFAPHMKRMVERGELQLDRWRCGLPSATPSVQAGIMYGENFDMPGFRWFEKDSNTAVVFKYPSIVKTIKDRIASQGEGILVGGSSYVNLIDGGADRSVFTLSTWGQNGIMSGVRGLGFFFLFLLSPIRFFRVLIYSVLEYVTAVIERVLSYLGAHDRVRWEFIFPFIRVISNVIFRETETFGTVVDIFRGVPAIYTTYNGYDELAHHYGPSAGAAYLVLRGIDREVRQIDRIRRHSPNREYDLYVLSDHGQTPAVPFQHAYGLTLGDFVAERLSEIAKVSEQRGEEREPGDQMAFIIDELQDAETKAARSVAGVMGAIRRYLVRRFPTEGLQIDRGVEREQDVVVADSSSFANIYFNSTDRQLDLSEIEIMFPGLVADLAGHGGIGLLVGREKGSVVLVSDRCRMDLDEAICLDGCRPLEGLEEPLIAAEEIRRLVSFPHSGDLIVFGAYRNGKVICFEDQVGAHGGWGGPQGYPFIMYPSQYHIETSKVVNARQLHEHFVATYPRGKGSPSV
jgi:hypothetical protein